MISLLSLVFIALSVWLNWVQLSRRVEVLEILSQDRMGIEIWGVPRELLITDIDHFMVVDPRSVLVKLRNGKILNLFVRSDNINLSSLFASYGIQQRWLEGFPWL